MLYFFDFVSEQNLSFFKSTLNIEDKFYEFIYLVKHCMELAFPLRTSKCSWYTRALKVIKETFDCFE